MSHPKVFIVILNYNGAQDTLECLYSICKINYHNYEIVIVDNASQDNSIGIIRDAFPAFTLIQNKHNLGFAGGNNKGIEYALLHNAEYILLLNNDTIVDPQLLNNLLDAADKYPEAGMLGPKIYYHNEPKKIWYAGAVWNHHDVQFYHEGIAEIDDKTSWNRIKETAYVCGCALLVKAAVIQKIGIFEEKYFLTWEDVDWCFRAKRAGFKSLFVPNGIVWHKVSSSFNGGATGLVYRYFFKRNRLLWIERHIPLSQRIRMYLQVFYRDLGHCFCVYIRKSSSHADRLTSKVTLQALFDYLTRRSGTCPSWIHLAAHVTK